MNIEGSYIAIIGDLVGSRKLPDRQKKQEDLQKALGLCNDSFKEKIVSKFVVTIGDEFQSVVKPNFPFSKFFWFYDSLTSAVFSTRFGLGIGGLSTEIKNVALEMDGPCLHRARTAIRESKSNKERIIVKGYDSVQKESFLNMCFSILNEIEKSWTEKQKKLVKGILGGKTQSDLAAEMNISRQAVYIQLNNAAWPEYEKGWDTVEKFLNPKKNFSLCRNEAMETLELILSGLEKRMTKYQLKVLRKWYIERSIQKVAASLNIKYKTANKVLRAANYLKYEKGKDFLNTLKSEKYVKHGGEK